MNAVNTNGFDWSRVTKGATFYHAHYVIPGTRQPEMCTVKEVRVSSIQHLDKTVTIRRVFYTIGSTGETVWTTIGEFPGMVRAWAPRSR